jgi:hypothetical protein
LLNINIKDLQVFISWDLGDYNTQTLFLFSSYLFILGTHSFTPKF